MRIGIDLGGTKIEAIGIDDAGRERRRGRVPTPQGDYDGTVRAIVDLVGQVERDVQATGTVGVGTPGAISPATGLIKNANSVCLNGRPLDRDLAASLKRPVRLANDANCFALSEATDGAAEGATIVFGVILGTGTGGGLVIDGHIVTGANAIAGEWGHTPMPGATTDEIASRPCYCGRNGCVETFLSGPALERDFAARSGRALSARQVAEAAADDAEASRAMGEYEERLARGLAGIINILDPDVIVLGGGVSNIERLFQGVPARWTTHVFSDRVDTRLVQAQHGDSSGVRGAAWLWPAIGVS